jgi:uncharacterized membrane protein YqjE
MTWLTWRQYRIQFAVGTAVLAALCLLAVPHDHQRMRVKSCRWSE